MTVAHARAAREDASASESALAGAIAVTAPL